MFENSKWIAASRELSDSSYLFRTEFNVERPVKSAIMNVCGLGYGVYYINGKSVTDNVLITPLTRFDKRVLYTTYDITGLLADGKNAVGAMTGNGWYNDIAEVWDFEKADWRHYQKLIIQIDIEYTDGTTETVNTNSKWKTSYAPVTWSHVRCGEIYDARLEQDGWSAPCFDDSNWESAFICPSPGGILEPDTMPPVRITHTIKAKKINNRIYDIGQNLSGWAKIRVKGRSGADVHITYGEVLNEFGYLENDRINCFNKTHVKHSDQYFLKGSGDWEEFEPHFVYHGFRYMDIRGNFDEIEVYGQFVHTDLPVIGEFECSDKMLNKIHSAARWSTLSNYVSIPTDCPHREQNGWTGDMLVSLNQVLMNYDAVSSFSKWLNDFKDCQRPSGQLPGIIPTSGWGYNWVSGPAWDSALIQIPYYVYQIHGDKSLIQQVYDNMARYMEFMNSMADDFIVNYGLGDWCPPPGAKICDTAVTDTSIYYANARIMAECSEIIGKDGSQFRALAENIRKAFRSRFLSGSISDEDCQTKLAACLYNGLYNEEEIPVAAKKLAELVEEKDYHIDCGILGAKFIFDALADNGYSEVLYRMVTNPTCPSYAYWIGAGLTTLAEEWALAGWDGKLNSLNHHMFSEVDMWFYKHLAGIQISDKGIVIKPDFISAVDWVRAKHREIEVYWDKGILDVTVPDKATVIINDKTYGIEKGSHKFELK